MNITAEIAALEQLTVGELQQRHVELFSEAARSRHRQYLIRRIAWRMQANAEGGLSERALRRAEELANVADARVTPPRGDAPQRAAAQRTTTGNRLPPIGTAITRRYKGRTISVTVLPDGFEFEGERFKSLTAVAKAVSGSHVNGYRFFGLGGQR